MHRIQSDAEGNLFEHDFRVCDAYAGGMEATARVTCKAHLIVGSRDVMTPAKATQALAGMLNAAVTRIVSGHALMQEAPEAVLNAMRQAIPA
jgi:pimeloyl-ACP methyl ester carboxylesterase